MTPIRQRLQALLPKNAFVNSILALAGGTALAQGLTLLVLPLLTRLYTPADFGVLAVYTSILGIITTVASLKFELAIPLAKDRQTAAHLLTLSLGVTLVMACVTALLTWAMGDRLIVWTKTPQLAPFLWLLPLGMLNIGMYQAFNYWAIYKQSFGIIARTKLEQGLAQSATQVGLGFFGVAPLGLLIGQLFGQGAGTFSLARSAWREDKRFFEAVQPDGVKQVTRRYRRFPLISSGSALLNSAGLQLPALLLAALYDPQIVGWFALSERVIRLPLSFVGQSVAQVYLGEASRLALSDPHKLKMLFRKMTRNLFLVGLIPLGSIALLAPWLFQLVFGEEWQTAGRFVQILSLMFLMRFVVAPLSQTLNILERQDVQLIWDVCRLALVGLAFYLANVLQQEALQAITFYAVAMTLAYIALYVLTARVLSRLVDTKKFP